MSPTFWLTTAQTVIFLALCAWAWWATGRITQALDAAEQAAQHAMAATQDAHRCLRILRDYWQRINEPPDVPTVPEAAAVQAVPDEFITEQIARLRHRLEEPRP